MTNMSSTIDATKTEATTIVVPTPKSLSPATTAAPLSPALSVVWIFVTHGLVNAGLLSPLNPVRCAYFVGDFQALCISDAAASDALNWWALSLLHVHLLLAALATTAVPSVILEQRLLTMTVAIITASLSTGVHMLPFLNPPMAALQAVIFVALLLGTAHQVAVQHATGTSVVPTCTLTELRNTSFDARRKLPLATLVLALQFLVVASWVVLHTLTPYASTTPPGVVTLMTHAGVTCWLWVALIMGASVVAATALQQKVMLRAHALVLFGAMLLVATELQHVTVIDEPPPQAKVMVGTFGAMVFSLLGAM